MKLLSTVSCLLAASLLSTAGCQQASRSESPSDQSAQVVESTANPVWVDKHERLRRAVEGLNFESGMVEIDAQAAEQFFGRGGRRAAVRHMLRGAEQLEGNERIAAIQSYKRAIFADPELPQAYEGLADGLIAKGKTEFAIAALRTTLDLDADRVDARFTLASVLGMADRLDESIAEYRAVLEAQPDYAEAHERLAIAYYYDGDYASAWEHVHAADDVGVPVPPQFLALLQTQMQDPQE